MSGSSIMPIRRWAYPLSHIGKVRLSWKVIAMHVCFALQLVAIGCLIVALCRPQTHDHLRTSRIEGTDIVIALDISGSMSARDFNPTDSRLPRMWLQNLSIFGRTTIWVLWSLLARAFH